MYYPHLASKTAVAAYDQYLRAVVTVTTVRTAATRAMFVYVVKTLLRQPLSSTLATAAFVHGTDQP